MKHQVVIVSSRLTEWGVCENRARLLVQSFIKMEEYELANIAKALLKRARLGYDDECDKMVSR